MEVSLTSVYRLFPRDGLTVYPQWKHVTNYKPADYVLVFGLLQMHFEGSSNVTLLFNFWDVRGPAGTWGFTNKTEHDHTMCIDMQNDS